MNRVTAVDKLQGIPVVIRGFPALIGFVAQVAGLPSFPRRTEG
jgi:hypothetical protein